MASKAKQPPRPAAREAAPIRHDARIVVLASRFNNAVTQALVSGAIDALRREGVPEQNLTVLWVPGAFELPIAAASAADALKPQGIVAVGCLLKGETSQYVAIGHAVANGLTQVSVAKDIPVTCGVIVAESLTQAKARAGGSVGHRGKEAALAALEMIELKQRLAGRSQGRQTPL